MQAFKFIDLHSSNGHKKILEITITFIFVENGLFCNNTNKIVSLHQHFEGFKVDKL